MKRIPSLALIACTLAMVLAMPTAAAAKTPTTTTKPTATTTTKPKQWPPLRAFDPSLGWAPCHDGWECATLTVPVDWVTKPKAGSVPEDTVPLALVRHVATDPGARIGALFINPGGPGEGGAGYIPIVTRRYPAELLARFDLVSWDPRGTGGSRPIDCLDDAGMDAITDPGPAIPLTAEQLAASHADTAVLARGCTERMGSYAGQVGTRNTARDLEAIRIALGEPSINYVGYSYGTVLGMTYAQMFPKTIRTMVLDGPPDVWLPTLDYQHTQAVGFRDALDAFLGWCEQTSTCALRNVGAPRDVFESLRTSLATTPVATTYTSDGATRTGTVDEGVLVGAVIASLYDERSWPDLGRALANATRGDARALLQISDSRLGRSTDGHWDPTVEANLVISCVDRPEKPRTDVAELADVLRFQAEIPPWGGGWAVSGCTGMPKAAKGDALGDVKVAGTAPILVIGTTGDPATPYSGAVSMLTRVAGSTLLTFESTEHTAFGTARSDCIDAVVTRYLVDQTMPAPNTRC